MPASNILLRRVFGRASVDRLGACAYVRSAYGDRGIAFYLAENLSSRWQSGDILIHWTDGEVTTWSEDCEVVAQDAWARLEAAT